MKKACFFRQFSAQDWFVWIHHEGSKELNLFLTLPIDPVFKKTRWTNFSRQSAFRVRVNGLKESKIWLVVLVLSQPSPKTIPCPLGEFKRKRGKKRFIQKGFKRNT